MFILNGERCIRQMQLCTERHQIIENREHVYITAELEPSHLCIPRCVARAFQLFLMPIAIMVSSCPLIPFPKSFRERMEGSFFDKGGAMQDFITLGTAPVDEPCAQLGQDDYYDKVKGECRRFITSVAPDVW